jgi:hypothetical protein
MTVTSQHKPMGLKIISMNLDIWQLSWKLKYVSQEYKCRAFSSMNPLGLYKLNNILYSICGSCGDK